MVCGLRRFCGDGTIKSYKKSVGCVPNSYHARRFFMGFYSPKCVDWRRLFRCRSASFFRRMAASGHSLYLHSIIHISCLVFFGRMKYNKKCYRRYECRACLAAPNKYRNISRLAQEEMW